MLPCVPGCLQDGVISDMLDATQFKVSNLNILGSSIRICYVSPNYNVTKHPTMIISMVILLESLLWSEALIE